MKFKTDENIPVDVLSVMVLRGHDVASVYTQSLQGTSDSHLASVCAAEGRALLTLDLDFANIAAYPPEKYCGILVLRPHNQSIPMIHILVRKLLAMLEQETPHGALWIVEPDRIRIMHRPPSA
ncbi:MAG: hypothetical protein BWY09_01573 [Candidatus Hydrogenedentes bacterium ADurb.Bin179]|nr:MAG: hypothetical protein BWY09_01573 [Candidatus Hydrogenedentes bacterium ADurb.Bin179]